MVEKLFRLLVKNTFVYLNMIKTLIMFKIANSFSNDIRNEKSPVNSYSPGFFSVYPKGILFLPLLLILFNRFFQNITCRFHGHLAAVFRFEGLGFDVLA